MAVTTRKLILLASIASLLVLPILGYGGLPPNFAVFPAQKGALPEPGLSMIYFVAAAAVCLGIAAFLVLPALFGFRPPRKPAPRLRAGSLPRWFWPGVGLTLFFWLLMWGQFPVFGRLLNYTFVPLWWGFILLLDGLVYQRSGGRSLLATRPRTLLAVLLVSIVNWFMFEYFNYFVNSNWFYPINTLFSTAGYLVWFTLAYTTVTPAIFEWYNLLNTLPALRNRYTNGPKVRLSLQLWTIILLAGLAVTLGVGLFPFLFFFGVWIGPLLTLLGAMGLAGFWTPLAPIARGNWGPFLLMALASLCNGFFWEGWNYFSPPSNPNYWVYEIPYVDIGLHYGEMPILGLFGYLPFGVLCWAFWLAAAHLLDLSPDVGLGLDGEKP